MTPHSALTGPTSDVPARRPGSVRRTTSLAAARPAAEGSSLRFEGRGREVVTATDGTTRVLPSASVRASTRHRNDTTLLSLVTRPPVPRLGTLVGHDATRGFRRAIHRLVPEHAGDGSVLVALLEDLPPVADMSGKILSLALGEPLTLEVTLPKVGICAGYAPAAPLGRRALAGLAPVAPDAVPAPALDDSTCAWTPAQPGALFRRLRRTDVTVVAGELHVDAWFRDSHAPPGRPETVVHEYTTYALVRVRDLVVTSCRAVPRVLPTPECAAAAASARDIEGRPLVELREWVRRELRGVDTCTHLNEELRALGDVHAMVRELT